MIKLRARERGCLYKQGEGFEGATDMPTVSNCHWESPKPTGCWTEGQLTGECSLKWAQNRGHSEGLKPPRVLKGDDGWTPSQTT